MDDTPIEQMPEDAKPVWRSTNGHTWWLEWEGKEYVPPRWVYWLCHQAEKKGRNEARRHIRRELELEE